ncbi:MAG: exodeoxyribonuclease VII small subunit [Clostridia bacterium]|nr:exodeoxyribonuclease VII small subunit [Clostridia bacterium]
MEEENISFESAMEELELIAKTLEKGDLNLDESVKQFEKGIKLSKKCNEILESAEKKISILIQDGEDLKEEEFTHVSEL